MATKRLGGLLKRFEINKVFKPLGLGEHPLEMEEASFDIIYDSENYTKHSKMLECEVMKIGVDVIELFNKEFSMVELRVNDTRILDALLESC
jgi:hypothetical protein